MKDCVRWTAIPLGLAAAIVAAGALRAGASEEVGEPSRDYPEPGSSRDPSSSFLEWSSGILGWKVE